MRRQYLPFYIQLLDCNQGRRHFSLTVHYQMMSQNTISHEIINRKSHIANLQKRPNAFYQRKTRQRFSSDKSNPNCSQDCSFFQEKLNISTMKNGKSSNREFLVMQFALMTTLIFELRQRSVYSTFTVNYMTHKMTNPRSSQIKEINASDKRSKCACFNNYLIWM